MRVHHIVLALSMLVLSCRQDSRPDSIAAKGLVPPGTLLAGDTAAKYWKLHATDTLYEVATGAVPLKVRQTADSIARFRGRPTDCTRYFVLNTVTAALLDAECHWPRGYLDGLSVVGIDSNGSQLGPIDWPATTSWAAPQVCPAYRDRASDSAWQVSSGTPCMEAPITPGPTNG
jgi:hypothetical protein